MLGSTKAARGVWLLGLLFFSLAHVALSGCGSRPPLPTADQDEPPELLSAWHIFEGNGASQTPVAGVIPYDLNTPLFSDYTTKYRFVRVPAGAQAKYNGEKSFDFPVGTVIAKTFAYPHDMTDASQGQRLLETRLLLHKSTGWVGLPYIWNAEQTEAHLELAGGTLDCEWIHTDGTKRTNHYLIPNANQCKGCHKEMNETMGPIGPKARNLNRDFIYHDGKQETTENQLAHWSHLGILEGAPDPAAAPRLAVWNDPATGSLDARARAWLEINCAHCHNSTGHARNSGLDLTTAQSNPFYFGVMKPPVAAGRGSGGLHYDIVPGKPDDSIMLFRMASTEADVMMPELGKRLVHDEGVALIHEWIAAMQPAGGAAATP